MNSSRWRLGPSVLLALASFAIVAFMVEIGIRIAIAAGLPQVRNPGLYADPYSDDAFWILTNHWMTTRFAPRVGAVHPTLGWATPVSPSNPLGAVSRKPLQPEFEREVVLFFGDSFVGGAVKKDADRIPQLLDQRLPEHPVYNLGGGGYGVDQILLRFRLIHPRFKRPLVLFGLLTHDLDRSVLRVRTAAKPYFTLHDGDLVLGGVPVPEDPLAWMAGAEPDFQSYFGALLMRHIRLTSGPDPSELRYRRADKQRLNLALLRAAATEARERKIFFAFVVFHNKFSVTQLGWRDAFFAEVFAELEMPVLDTRQPLLDAARRSGRPIEDFYNRTDPHLGPRGNRVVADALAAFLEKHAGLLTTASSQLGSSD